jgi:hypothetical protein
MFRDVTALPNICGAIDGIQIPLIRRPSLHITLWAFDFFQHEGNFTVLCYKRCVT